MLRELSHAKAQEAPSSCVLSWSHVGTQVDANAPVTCATAFAASLVEPARHISWCHTGGETPLLADLFESDPR